MEQSEIIQYIADTFPGVDIERPEKPGDAPEIALGDTFFIYDPQRNLEPNRRWPFATIVTKDYGDFDCASNLNRPGIFRLNIGIGKATFLSLFGSQASRSDDSGQTEPSYDFTALDELMPHPVYGQMFWVCVLNPSKASFEKIRPLLAEAYELAVNREKKREAR
jgi:hypothetical protein